MMSFTFIPRFIERDSAIFIFIFIMNMIIMNRFINREEELKFLSEKYRSGKPELIIIYGRRRIGKTFLIRKFMERVDRGAYVVVKRPGRDSLRDFSEALRGFLGFTPRLDDFQDLYLLLNELSGDRFLLVIDEFQRLAEKDQIFLMEMQAAWDQFLSNSKVMLVLMGSSVGTVERVGISPSSPIYGRRTGIIKLKPFPFSCAKEFMKSFGDEDKVRGYSVFGGTPAYLDMLDQSLDLTDNLFSLVLRRGAPLKEEPLFFLSQETREPLRYMAILEELASGANTLGEIASKSGIRVTDLPRYLKILERDLDIVRREYPIMERKRSRARYRISDEFFRFWFRFVHPNWELLEMGGEEKVLELVMKDLDNHASFTFEEIAKEHLLRTQEVERVGRWWKGDVEIDIIGLKSEPPVVTFAEVKWTSKPVGREVLNSLITKASLFNWKREKREEKYIIYSRSGFSFDSDEAELVDLSRLIRELNCRD